MKTSKNMGIWMDHSSATLIELKDSMTSQTIESAFTKRKKLDAINRSENLMHNKEQQLNEAFYSEIANEILNYDHVLIFGPTDARLELQNYLNRDLHFKHIKIDVKSADKMTENEKFAFVKRYFAN